MPHNQERTDASFAFSGYWWASDAPGDRWAGTLRFDPTDGAVLTVTASVETPTLLHDLREYDVVHGMTTSGKPVSLLNCFERRVSGALHGPIDKEVFANAVFVGCHVQSNNPLVLGASLSTRHLLDWWGQSGLSRELSVTGSDQEIHYRRPEDVHLYSGEGLNITLKAWLRERTQKRHHIALIEDVSIRITSDRPRPLSEMQQVVQACTDFFTIACLAYCSSEELEFDLPSQSDGHSVGATFHAVPIYTPSVRRTGISADFLFRLADIRERAAEVFGRWLTISERLAPVRSLYLSGAYGEGFLEVKLVALAQAAEAYHRRCYSGTYLERATFEEGVLERLVAAVPADIDPSFRMSLRKRLKYANEYSLRKRLRALIAEHERPLSRVVTAPKSYADRIVDHRNAFTHQPVEGNEEQPSDRSEELLRCIYVLRLLLELCFLKEAGLSSDEMDNFMAKSETYRQIKLRFFQFVS